MPKVDTFVKDKKAGIRSQNAGVGGKRRTKDKGSRIKERQSTTNSTNAMNPINTITRGSEEDGKFVTR